MAEKYFDPTALSYWFPKLANAGLPVPKTILIDMPKPAQESMLALMDGQEGGDPKPFFGMINLAAETLGYPVFLRTDHTSGKHNWRDTCYLTKFEDIPKNVWGIVEYSELAGFMGVPWNRWAVREFLPTKPYGVCTGYGDMPICREFRFFVKNAEIECYHPYWPLHALEQGYPEMREEFVYEKFSEIRPDEQRELFDLASRAGEAVGGEWSVDILETSRGWYVTDMAEASKSYHWPGCPNSSQKGDDDA